MSYLPCIEVNPETPADCAIIWLHGLGADGRDFEAVIPELNLDKKLALRFVFPNAPTIPVTINGGYEMPAWYDILEMDVERKVDEAQLCASAAEVHKLIDREIERGINSSRILLAGFSQGGAVNYQAALTYPKPLAGLLALSTYFATAATVQCHPANENLVIEVYHGSVDPVVHEQLGLRSVENLQGLGYQPNYKNYPMEHSLCMDEIADISQWINSRLA